MNKDLSKSGITARHMGTRPMTATEIAITAAPVGAKGYVIPYYNMQGKPLPFYRVRLFYDEGAMQPGQRAIKYKQPEQSTNHVYFPLGFWGLVQSLLKQHSLRYILLTEGEKKATAAVAQGFPCAALSGVDSWRNRTYRMPKGTTLGQNAKGQVVAKLPKDQQADEITSLATGMQDLIELCDRNNVALIMVYDSDIFGEAQKYEVLRAAATLGYELRLRGLPGKNIRHLTLESPPISTPVVEVPIVEGEVTTIDLSAFKEAEDAEDSIDEPDGGGASPHTRFAATFKASTPGKEGGGKVGLDDYLLHPSYGARALRILIDNCLRRRSAFPRHPNPKDYIGKRLGRQKLSRGDYQSISFAIIADMDAKGLRIRSQTGAYYYFDYYKRRLYNVSLSARDIQTSDIGNLLYANYGVSCLADSEVVKWFLPQFASEEPITMVSPKRLVATGASKATRDNIYVQLNDGQFAKLGFPTPQNPEPELEILDNGDEDILFEAGQTQGLDMSKLLYHYEALKKKYPNKLPNWWYETLKGARIGESPNDNNRKVLSLLYFVSPFYNRWRGTELPVEIAIGEAGSGKSTLYSLRQEILVGKSELSNVPKDLKDFAASASSTGGLYVMDNVHMADKTLRQKLSDEICRLVTEPNPSIQQRKLYTDNELIRIGINCVFGITAISQPFTNVDIIQRSIVLQFDKHVHVTDDGITYDAGWRARQLTQRDGREAWLALHLLALERIQKAIYKFWDPYYRAKYRLINLEQLLLIASRVFDMEVGEGESDGSWVGKAMEADRDRRMLDTDSALAGLKAFADAVRAKYTNPTELLSRAWDVRDISAWFQTDEDYNQHKLLCEPRSLGRYLTAHSHAVGATAGIHFKDSYANRARYQVRPIKEVNK